MEKRGWMGVGAGILVGVISVGTLYGISHLNSNGQGGVIADFQKVPGLLNKSAYNQTKAKALSEVIRTAYIGESNNEDMIEGIYKGYVYGVGDGYTTYLDADNFSKEETEEQGNYIGTGIRFTWGITNQHLVVTDVVPNSPADQAGIVVGDKIFEIDGIKAMGSNDTKIYEKLAYTGNNPVEYVFMNNEETETKTVQLVVDVVEVNLINSKLLKDHIGYIELSGLVEDTPNLLKQSIDQLLSDGATQLILDLRSASSSNCEAVQALTNLFIGNEEVFSVKNKDGSVTPYSTTEALYDIPLVVLTSTFTEGVIEAFPAAVQAFDRGLVVGDKTAGNGTTHIRVPLEDGSGLSITTGIVLDATGNQIMDEGITPDVAQKTTTDNTLELVTTGMLKLENDVVVQKAIEVLK